MTPPSGGHGPATIAYPSYHAWQMLMTRPREEWLHDVAARYRALEQFTQEDSRLQFLRILRSLPYGARHSQALKLPYLCLPAEPVDALAFRLLDPLTWVHLMVPFLSESVTKAALPGLRGQRMRCSDTFARPHCLHKPFAIGSVLVA